MKTKLNSLPSIGALLTVVIAVFGLLGYIPGLAFLGRVREDYIPMAPSTALSFIILGFILIIINIKRLPELKSNILMILALLVSLFGILEVAGHFIGIDLNFENTLVPFAGTLGEIPVARMSPATGTAFFLSGIVVFLFIYRPIILKSNMYLIYFKGGLSILVLIISFIFCLAYIYGTPLLYGQSATVPMALSTAIGFMFLSISTLTFENDTFPMNLLTGSTTRSYLLRFILPLSTLSVILGGLMVFASLQLLKINPAFMSAALTVFIILSTGLIATFISRLMGNKIEKSSSDLNRAYKDLSKEIEERKQAEELLLQQTNELETINTFGNIVTSAKLDLKEVFDKAMRGFFDTIHPDIAFLFLRDGEKLILKNILPSTGRERLGEIPEHKVGECICGLSVTQKKALYSRDIFKDNRCTWEECKNAGMKSFASLPLIDSEEVIGVIGIASDKERDFEQQSEFLETLTSQISMAVVNARLYNTGQKELIERKKIEVELLKHRNHLEELVKERTKELEAFSYSVSHDLRAPLRAIDGFTRILIDDYASKLDKEGKRLGSIIQGNAKKMGKLIDDLLAFSRLGRTSMTYSKIDMRNMVNAIYHEATSAEERKRIKFNIAELVPIEGDTNMMRQVWMNLISNAVKFSSQRKRAVISVTSQEEKEKITYCIKDNGAGFNMKYVDKLFGVFQRLHSEKDFMGTGIGLSLVQRIVHRHDGNVWAEGKIDKGASFYFSLPNKKRKT